MSKRPSLKRIIRGDIKKVYKQKTDHCSQINEEWGVAVEKLYCKEKIEGLDNPGNNFIYGIIQIYVVNLKKDTNSFYLKFSLFDNNNNKYEIIRRNHFDNPLKTKNFGPREYRRGNIGFRINKNIINHDLYLRISKTKFFRKNTNYFFLINGSNTTD